MTIALYVSFEAFQLINRLGEIQKLFFLLFFATCKKMLELA
jgi:hypothetical protein